MMGFDTRLYGSIHLTKEAFQTLLSINELDWTWDDNTIADYLRNDFSYDAKAQKFSFDTEHSMYHNRAFFQILASLKDIEGIDTVEQQGETYDFWFRRGRFFIRPGSWAYVGRGPMVTLGEPEKPPPVIGPDDPKVEHIERWEKAARLISKIKVIDDDFLDVILWTGERFRVLRWLIDEFLNLEIEELEQFTLIDGGAVVSFCDGSIRIDSDILYRFRESQ